ncbi:Prolyl oligopeptidase family protein [Zea mays]|uniref:Prolyl oligopeptidase family protein n=1 Tax=Zea mays TaxID=4577 RepID=A0A1R3N2S0_MAIZE|nr:Prolyl oligopeptidase family protein [Zea mays]
MSPTVSLIPKSPSWLAPWWCALQTDNRLPGHKPASWPVEDLEVSPAQRNALRNLPVCCVDRWWQLHRRHHIDELTVKHWVDQDDPGPAILV